MSKYFSKTNFVDDYDVLIRIMDINICQLGLKLPHYQTVWRNIGVQIQQYEN